MKTKSLSILGMVLGLAMAAFAPSSRAQQIEYVFVPTSGDLDWGGYLFLPPPGISVPSQAPQDGSYFFMPDWRPHPPGVWTVVGSLTIGTFLTDDHLALVGERDTSLGAHLILSEGSGGSSAQEWAMVSDSNNQLLDSGAGYWAYLTDVPAPAGVPEGGRTVLLFGVALVAMGIAGRQLKPVRD